VSVRSRPRKAASISGHAPGLFVNAADTDVSMGEVGLPRGIALADAVVASSETTTPRRAQRLDRQMARPQVQAHVDLENSLGRLSRPGGSRIREARAVEKT